MDKVYKVTIDSDTEDKIFKAVVEERIQDLNLDLNRYNTQGFHPFPVYSTDKEEDIKLIKKQIKAYKRVLKDFKYAGF